MGFPVPGGDGRVEVAQPGAIGADLHDLGPARHLGLQVATIRRGSPPVGDVESGAQRCQVGAMRVPNTIVRPPYGPVLKRGHLVRAARRYRRRRRWRRRSLGGRTWFAGPMSRPVASCTNVRSPHERDGAGTGVTRLQVGRRRWQSELVPSIPATPRFDSTWTSGPTRPASAMSRIGCSPPPPAGLPQCRRHRPRHTQSGGVAGYVEFGVDRA